MATDPLLESDGVERDGLGRPKIIPLRNNEPNIAGKLVAYTRASTFAKAISDSSGLIDWKVRHAAVGIAISPDLAAMVGALGTNPDNYTKAQKQELDAILETAHDRSGGNAKANYGTAIHTLTVPGNEGYVPNRMAPDVDAYDAALASLGLEPVDSERFVVHDGLKVAGTYDHRYRLTRDLSFDVDKCPVFLKAGLVVMGDKKTGRLHPDENAIQLALYSWSDWYDPDTGERTTHDASNDYGIVVHIPAGESRAEVHVVDLTIGWEAVQHAKWVRGYRSATLKKAWLLEAFESDLAETVVPAVMFDELAAAEAQIAETFGDVTPVESDPILRDIADAQTAEVLRHVWGVHRATWTEAHTAASKARIAELEAA